MLNEPLRRDTVSFYNVFDDSSQVIAITTEKDREEAFQFMRDMGLFPDGLADFLLGVKVRDKIVG